MSILFMYTDDRNPGSRTVELENPKWEDVERAVRRLDGVRFTNVSLSQKDEVGMSITGGYEGRYMCDVLSEARCEGLIDPSRSRDDTVAIIKDESPDFPEYWTVSVALVLLAAKSFFDTGEPDSSLEWKRS